MVMAARRAYSEAVRWLKASRPRRIDSGRFAMRCFGGSLAAGIVLLGLVGLLSPSSFNVPGSRALAGKWTLALAGLVALCALILLANLRHLRWLLARIREPFVRPLGTKHFEGAADALASAPGPLQSRWATSWVWGPALLAVAGVTFAFSSAYFVVGAVLSGGRIGWGNPVVAAINALLSILSFAIGATRLSTWRLALSVHREVSGRYLE
jgi:hypothetical protein